MEKSCLKVNHSDLIELGIPVGTILDDVLEMLCELVECGDIENTKGVLLERAKEIVRMAI